MRGWFILSLPILIVAAIGTVVQMHDDHVIVAKKPPQSIAQWYKPENKRQVWLHTMFELRREMLAIETYAQAEDPENLNKWVKKLGSHYRKIASMVPEWASRLDLDALSSVQKGADEKHYKDAIAALGDLNESCQSCHADFRAVTAALYRAPDFSGLKVAGDKPLNEHMTVLSRNVNHIKIAFVDGRDTDALSAFADLKAGMTELGESCGECHNKLGKKVYPDPVMSEAMETLEESLKAGDIMAKGRSLGMVAVLACAQCHGTHRLAFDAKMLFGREKNWQSLLQHNF
jgi:mono/diheme cytochrome c family protein